MTTGPLGAASPRLRLVLAEKRISRAVLDGAWWPRSWDVGRELPGLIQALSERYGRIRYVSLNPAAWEGRVRRLAVGDGVCRMGWFSSMSAALLVATTEGGDQLDLLVVPPLSAAAAAHSMMAAAADPSNMERAGDLLAASSTATTVAGRDILPEAVWDNEGGRPRSASRERLSRFESSASRSASRPSDAAHADDRRLPQS